jgi:hypothetical protein
MAGTNNDESGGTGEVDVDLEMRTMRTLKDETDELRQEDHSSQQSFCPSIQVVSIFEIEPVTGAV